MGHQGAHAARRQPTGPVAVRRPAAPLPPHGEARAGAQTIPA